MDIQPVVMGLRGLATGIVMAFLMALLMALLLVAPAVAQPSEPAAIDRWHLSGYATLGYADLRSDQARSFARDQTQDRPSADSVDSRLGVQLNVNLGSMFSATTQVVARKRAAAAPLSQGIEWAFLAFQPDPAWLLRLGRTSPDVFLYSDVRNLGVAYPWVRPSQEFYAWMPLQSMDGADVTRLWVGADVTWKLKAAYGHARATLVAQNEGYSVPAAAQGMGTLTLSRETERWLVKLSYLRGTVDLRRSEGLTSLDQGLTAIAALPLPQVAAQADALRDGMSPLSRTRYFALGTQYDDGQWLISSELSWIFGRASQANARRGYLSLGRRIDEWTFFALTGASVLPNPAVAVPVNWQAQLSPVIGPALAAQASMLGQFAAGAANRARVSQRSQGIGLRWDVLPRAALKLQWDRVRVDAEGSALWQLDSVGAVKARILSVGLDTTF